MCALLEAQRSGKGQVVDAAMVDGAACLMTMFHAFRAMGIWEDERGTNLLDTGAHFYDVYETADGKYVSIGSLEPQFYAELLRLTGLEGDPDVPWQHDKNEWPRMKERMREIFKTKTRDEWCEIMEGTDVCFAPVLSLAEAPQHPHNVHRDTFVELRGRRAAGAGAAVQPHAGRHPAPAGARRPAHRRGPRRLARRRRRPHRQVARRRRRVLTLLLQRPGV